jgi:rubrerythrin
MDLKLALETAMKGEIEGRELYQIAAERSDDEKAKDVFTYLAKEEDSHFEALKGMYHAYIKDQELVIPDLPRLVEFTDAENPIFSDSFKSRLEGRHFEMSALSIALKLEQDAFQYYQKVSDESDDEAIKSFFSRLSTWERDHYNALHREINYLEEDYFTDNSFSPF